MLFQNILFLKEFLALQTIFPWKRSLSNTLSIDKIVMSYLFPAQDIKQNVILRFYLDNWWL